MKVQCIICDLIEEIDDDLPLAKAAESSDPYIYV